ncbi:MAG: response regulator [Elusimicrobia bacterium]|nr:response regulator [Elusimicrobiota bacterium]
MGRKILLVEDESTIVELLRVNLQSSGFDIEAVSSGEEAMARLIRDALRPDAILLDVRLPGMTGWEICRRIKSEPDTRKIPVIILTAAAQKQDKEQAEESGADEYVTKPFDMEDIVNLIEKVTRKDGVRKILVAEDDLNIQELLRINLEAAGYAVTCVSRGDCAIEAVSRDKPDLLILDIIMPDQDGWEVCKTIRDSGDLSDMKILILTSKSSDMDRMIGKEILKADEYVTKPFDLDGLLSIVKGLIDG